MVYEKSITYKESDLKNFLKRVKYNVNLLNSYIKMAEEQGRGERDNLDWKSTSEILRKYFDDLIDSVNSLNIDSDISR